MQLMQTLTWTAWNSSERSKNMKEVAGAEAEAEVEAGDAAAEEGVRSSQQSPYHP